MARQHTDSGDRIITLRVLYDEVQLLRGEQWKLKTAIAVIAFGIFGQYIGLGDTVSQAMPFR